jgi:hypothetical protein
MMNVLYSYTLPPVVLVGLGLYFCDAARASIGVTNPPFAGSDLGDPIIKRTLELLDTGNLSAAVLLQRADAGGAAGRSKLFNRAAYEITCCWRPVWLPGTKGGGRWWFQWFVWLAGQSGPPINRRIQRSDLR